MKLPLSVALVRWISARRQDAFQARFSGKRVQVLFETGEDGLWSGYTGNYIRVSVRSDDILENALRNVVLGDSCGDFMTGELVPTQQARMGE